jgi:hypothetical protein
MTEWRYNPDGCAYCAVAETLNIIQVNFSVQMFKHICISKFIVKINPAPHVQKDDEGNKSRLRLPKLYLPILL